MPTVRRPLELAAALSLLMGLLAAPGASQLYPGQYTPLTLAESFGGKSGFAVADVNEDGMSDVLARQAPTTLRVLPGDGLGGVGPESLVSVAQSPIVLVADVTDDGHLDLVQYQLLQSQLFVAAGDGAGGFSAALAVPIGSSVDDFAVGDMDEDGGTDLVTANSVGLILIAGDGAGGFAAQAVVPVAGLIAPKALAVADFDGDTHLDVALGSGLIPAGGPIRILLGDGAGGFVAATPVPIGSFRALQILAADMDGDGDVDLVARAETSLSLPVSAVAVVLLGDGTGAFTSTVLAEADAQLTRLLLADDDHDGDLDVFVHDPSIQFTNGYLRVPNAGAGVFGEPAFALPEGQAFVGRFDGDAYDDLALFPAEKPGVVIAPGLEAGGFRMPVRYSSESFVWSPLIADLNGDGLADLIHGSLAGPAQLSVRLGDGTGNLGEPLLSPFAGAAGQLALGDLDEDGAPDVAVSPGGAPQFSVGLGDGRGGFAPAVNYPLAGGSHGMLVADMNDDGHLDLVTVAGTTGTAALAVLPGDGSGVPGAAQLSPSASLRGAIATADFDHDGALDVVGSTNLGVRVLLGDGAGGVAQASDYPVAAPSQVGYVAVADVNLDGHADVLTAHIVGTFGVLLGDGAGGLSPAQVLSAGSFSQAGSISVADVSGDGLPDVLLPRNDSDRYFVQLGDGLGGFALESAGYVMGQAPTGLTLGDLNGDHRVDVAAQLLHAVGIALHDGPAFTWTDLGHGLASGSTGAPHLAGTGTLLAGQSVKLVLSGARPLAPAWLVVGLTNLSLPFKGGTLVPNPGIVLLVQTNAVGSLILHGPMPPGTPSGLTRYFQYWIADPGAPAGVSASNALAALTP